MTTTQDYVIKFQCDFKWELKEDKNEPTRNDIRSTLEEWIQGLTTSFDSLTGAKREAEIIAKAVFDKVWAWYFGTCTLRVDGTKYEIPASIDTDTPIDNPMTMIAEIIKKLTNGMRHLNQKK